MSEKKKKLTRYLIALVIVVASVYFTVRRVDLVKLWHYLVNANYFWAIVPIPIMLLSHWVRALRWRTMLEPAIGKRHTWNLFSAVMVGYAFNNILPRGAEFLRPYVYSRREKVSFSTLFATIMLERVIDLITLLLLFGGVFFFFREQLKQAIPNLQIDKILLPTILVIVALIFCFYPPFVKFMLRVFIKPISGKFFDKISGIFDRFMEGFTILRRPSQYVRLILESLSIWLFYTMPMFIMFFCFNFQSVYHLGFDDAILLIVISGIGFTVAPTPGAIGVYHFLIQTSLIRLYGISAEEALAYATVTHAMNFLVQVIVGGLFVMRENIKKLPHEEDIKDEKDLVTSPE